MVERRLTASLLLGDEASVSGQFDPCWVTREGIWASTQHAKESDPDHPSEGDAREDPKQVRRLIRCQELGESIQHQRDQRDGTQRDESETTTIRPIHVDQQGLR